jgi:hypothetical protein
MRKRIAIGTGLVVIALVIVGRQFVSLSEPPYDPPLRAGMYSLESTQILSKLGYHSPIVDEEEEALSYWHEPDWLGNRHQILVSLDEVCRVTKWRVKPLPRTRPPWLDRVLKAVGW